MGFDERLHPRLGLDAGRAFAVAALKLQALGVRDSPHLVGNWLC
jgi:hypothetical protein